jgi:amidase
MVGTSSDIWRLSAVDQAAGIRGRRFSAMEAVASSVARMGAVNGKLNAVVVDLSNKAMDAAKAADDAVARGAPLGALHGVPVTVKTNVDVAGEANSNGVPALKDNVVAADAPVVANLRKAGAILIGLTNTPEFSMRGFTENPLYGRTNNPWDPAITCGGSSGGAGAAVASGIGAVAHGNDIGGSLRWPAFCNGVATIKPTQGRIPAFNPSATAERPLLAQLMSSQGPLCREVRDVRLALGAMSQRDPRDPWWVPAPLDGPPLARPLKVAVVDVPAGYDVHPAIARTLSDAADMLRDAGYVVEQRAAPDIERPLDLWFDLLNTETEHLQMETYRKLASPDFLYVYGEYFKLGTLQDVKGYAAGMAERSRHVRNWMLFLEDYPVVLTPLCLQPSWGPRADLDGDTRAVFRSFLFQTGLNFLGLPCAVVPSGMHGSHPIGVQIVTGRYREDLALDAAEAIEKRAGIMAKRLWERG